MKKPLLALAVLMSLAPAALAQKATAPKIAPAQKPAPDKLSPADQLTMDHAFGLGLVAAGNGRYPLAITDFSKVIEIEPDNVAAYAQRGAAYFNTKQYAKAIADFTQVMQLDPTDTNSLENRALSYVKLKQYDNAVADFDNLLAQNPGALSQRGLGGMDQPLYGRGLARVSGGDLTGGYADTDLAHKQNPNIEKFYAQMGFAALPAKPKTLPATAGQSMARFREAITDTSKAPLLVLVTIVDDKTKASTTGCVTAWALIAALKQEKNLTDIAAVEKIALANKTRVFHFSKQPALDSLKIAVTQKDIDDAKKETAGVDYVTYDGPLPGYHLPAGVTSAIACSFLQQGKQVRLAKPDTIVLP